MHPVLEAVAAELDVELPALRAAATWSQELIDDARADLRSRIPASFPIDVVVFGSIARREATSLSDLDHLIVSFGLLPEPRQINDVIQGVHKLRRDRLELREPGGTGTFGRVVAATDLVEVIGLEEDTNTNHTRRILLLSESVSIFDTDRHAKLVRAVIGRYLADYEQPHHGVPRFLLNDVLRYWRQVAVDYQAKKWGVVDPDWGLRYLKLIISRKLLIAGTIASLLRCEEATVDYFVHQFGMPPLARLAAMRPDLRDDQLPALRTVLLVADRFLAALSDAEFREAASRVRSRSDLRKDARVADFVDQAEQLQKALERLFFDGHLNEQSRKYLSF